MDQRQARWTLFLSQFNLNLKHVPGKTLIQSDAISHLKHLNLEEENNKDVTLLPNDMFICMLEPDIKQRIKESPHYEEDIRNRIKLLTDEDLSKYNPDILKRMKQDLFDWQIEDRLVFYKGRCYMPEDQDLRRDLVQLHHDTIAASHSDKNATFALLQKDYWWPGMRTFVKHYVAGCIPCQQMKPNTHPTQPAINLIPPVNSLLLKILTMDFITDLLPSNGFDSILVVTDHDCSKEAVLIECHKTIDAIETAELLHRYVYK